MLKCYDTVGWLSVCEPVPLREGFISIKTSNILRIAIDKPNGVCGYIYVLGLILHYQKDLPTI